MFWGFFLGDRIKTIMSNRSKKIYFIFCFTEDTGIFVNIRTDILKKEQKKIYIFLREIYRRIYLKSVAVSLS